jgi:chemotaxis protein histidine kinase CheA
VLRRLAELIRAGATVLGDGRVALIVDPVELVDMVGRA